MDLRGSPPSEVKNTFLHFERLGGDCSWLWRGCAMGEKVNPLRTRFLDICSLSLVRLYPYFGGTCQSNLLMKLGPRLSFR